MSTYSKDILNSKESKILGREYFIPIFGKSICANSKEEALEKLKYKFLKTQKKEAKI